MKERKMTQLSDLTAQLDCQTNLLAVVTRERDAKEQEARKLQAAIAQTLQGIHKHLVVNVLVPKMFSFKGPSA